MPARSAPFLLQATDLTVYRNDRLIFKNLNFNLAAGELLQINGANGAGKSSLLKILTGLLPTYTGEIYWQALPLKNNYTEYYQDLFYLAHEQGLKDELTVYENINLDLRYSFLSRKQIDAALTDVNLENYRSTLCRELSQGQRQRVVLAKLILSKAKLWILDEPFAALDQMCIHWLQRIFQKKIAEGGSIIVTSHQALTLGFPFKTLEI